MGKFNGMDFKLNKINKHASKEEVKSFLSALTDEDFNGNNGCDYFIEKNINNKTILLSELDSHMLDFESKTNLNDFINTVLNDNYSNSYYCDFKCETIEMNDFIIVAFASLH